MLQENNEPKMSFSSKNVRKGMFRILSIDSKQSQNFVSNMTNKSPMDYHVAGGVP